MKHVHFFGCSFTAGDELADDDFFPWAKECPNEEEYYKVRQPILSNKDFYKKYTDACKLLSYPNLINNDKIKTYNHARLGASVKECVFHLMRAFNSADKIDQVFFQIPPYPRELIMGVEDVSSLQLSNIGILNSKDQYTNYMKQKILSHRFYQWAAEDLMDIISIRHYVKSRNIPFNIIIFSNELAYRLNFLPNYAKFLKKEISQVDDIIDLNPIIDHSNKLAGHHYHGLEHDKIKNHLLHFIQAE